VQWILLLWVAEDFNDTSNSLDYPGARIVGLVDSNKESPKAAAEFQIPDCYAVFRAVPLS
jgi:hypothetical protein